MRSLTLLLLGCAVAAPTLAEVKVGDVAPTIRLRDQEDKLRDVAESYGSWTALIFYPRDDTPGCTAEACSVRDSWPAFRDAGIRVYGISVDAVNSKAAFDAKYNLEHVLLADVDKEVCRTYGTLSERGFSNRVTFILDPARVVRFINRQVNPQQAGPNILAKVAELREADAQTALATLGPPIDSGHGFTWSRPDDWTPGESLLRGAAASWQHPTQPRLQLALQVGPADADALRVESLRSMLPDSFAVKVVEEVQVGGKPAIRGYVVDAGEDLAVNGIRFTVGDRLITVAVLSLAADGDAAARLLAGIAASIAFD